MQSTASSSPRLPVVAAASQNGATADKPKVVVLGTGLMGSKAAQRLTEEGFPVTAWNRDSSKAEALKKAGVESNENLTDAVGEADVALLLLADANAIDSVLMGDESVLAALKGRTVLQMGTIGPDQSREFNRRLGERGVKYLEAPVQGSHPEVAAGSLVIMVGSDEDPTTGPAWPVLEALGDKPRHMGKVGEAAAIKLAFNQLVASLMVGFATSLGLLERNNADVEKFMELLRESKLYAPTFDKKLPRMLDRDFTNPNFPTKHLLKDIQLFQVEAKTAGLDPSMLAGLEAIIAKTCKEGLDDTDYSAVYSGVNPET